jgi:Heterokaryon incompatibility protein (HET)
MEKVYRGATKIQVYIGADDTKDNSVQAMIYLERNFRSILKGDKNLFENFSYVDVLPRRTVDAITALLRRDWFYRVWVLQEVQSAKYAEIICGKYKIPWLALRIVAPSFYNAASSVELPLILDIAEGGLRSKDLLTWLRNTRSLRATDPRDKVYAMLTLAYNVNHRTAESALEEPFVISQMYGYQLSDWLCSLVKLNLISSDDILPVDVMVENLWRILKADVQRIKMVKTGEDNILML